MQTKSRKKIILITIIMAVVLVGMIILLVTFATRKPESNPDVVAETSSEVSNPESQSSEIPGEFVLEDQHAEPTSVSTSTSDPQPAEVATALPKTGPSGIFGLALLAGVATYFVSRRYIASYID